MPYKINWKMLETLIKWVFFKYENFKQNNNHNSGRRGRRFESCHADGKRIPFRVSFLIHMKEYEFEINMSQNVDEKCWKINNFNDEFSHLKNTPTAKCFVFKY